MAIKVDLHRRDERNRRWSENRWATAFNPINPKNGIWQSMISVTAPAGSPKANEFRREPILPRGAYLATIYLDQEGKTKKDPTYELGEREKIGQVEITGQWRPGYKPPKIIDFPQSSTGTAN